MCGRYQFTEPQNADLRRILQDVRRRCGDRAQDFRFGDVIAYRRRAGADRQRRQGSGRPANRGALPGWKGGLMINARAETVCEKPMFRRSMAAQRCVIPATSFYEWDAARHKYQFALPGEPLYLAGLYDNVDGANRFVILTTTPNASMHGIHDRMPLILRRDQIRPWLTDAESALHLLAAPPPLLERHSTGRADESFGVFALTTSLTTNLQPAVCHVFAAHQWSFSPFSGWLFPLWWFWISCGKIGIVARRVVPAQQIYARGVGCGDRLAAAGAGTLENCRGRRSI